MTARLDFLGAAQNVTGSCYLLEAAGRRLLVDCGIYQERDLTHRNWDPFPVKPDTVDAVLLTHAHLDHCGLLPKLVRDGFKGPVYCTPATADITRIVLRDSAKIQEEDAAFKKKRHERAGLSGPFPERPLYTIQEAEACFSRFLTADYGAPVRLDGGVEFSFHDAGHILGSSMIRVAYGRNGDRRTVVFSGDVGRWGAPILRDPTPFEDADYVLVESTYGNRIHASSESIPASLAAIVAESIAAGGNIVIPSFAIERTQELLYRLNGLLREKRIPRLPVFVDSPMAIRVTEVFERHPELFDEETLAMIRSGDHPCDFPGLILCRSVDESKAINRIKGTAIVIAGSGMCTGGRIKHHLANNIGRPESTLLFVGYQATGTLGRIILEGAANVRILGQEYPVLARVAKLNGLSAHADRDELFRWLSALRRPPRRVFVTHGEPKAATGFADWLRTRTGWDVAVAAYQAPATLD